MSLHRIATVRQSLLCQAYPKPSGTDIALPRLPIKYGNLNPFPFCALGITRALRIDLLWAEEHGPETRVLCGVQDSRLDMMLLAPGYS